MCKSPISAQINDETTNHTLLVLMQDVCGSQVKVLAKYGMWGYTLEEATKRGNKNLEDSEMLTEDAGEMKLNGSSGDGHQRVRSAAGEGWRKVPAAAVVVVMGALVGLWL